MILRQLKAYLFLALLIPILLVGILGRTSFHTKYIESYINNRISSSDWNFSLEKSSGFLFSTFYFENIQITDLNKSVYSIKKTAININLLSLLLGEWTLDLASFEGINGIIYNTKKNNKKTFKFSQFLKVPFNIKSLFINGKLNRSINENKYDINFFIGGSFTKKNGNNLSCDIFKVNIDNKPNLSFDLKELLIHEDSLNISLNHFNGKAFNLPVNGGFVFNKNTLIMKGELELVEFSIPEDLFDKIPMKNKFSKFKVKLDLETDLNYFSGNISLKNELGLNTNGKFLVSKDNKTWFLKNLKLNGENSELTINGLLEDRERVNCYINLSNLDLSRWMNGQKETDLSGLLILDASLENYSTLDQIDLTLEVLEEKLFHQGEISINGQISYKDSILTTIDPVLLFVEDNYLTIEGKGDFRNNEVSLLTILEKANIELVNNFLPGDFISGSATGKLNINGKFDSPTASSELLCENVKIEGFLLESLELVSKVQIDDDTFSGFLDVKAGEGTWREYSFESGTLGAIFNKDEIILDNCHFKSGKDFFQASGSIKNLKDYKIERLQIAYQNNYLVNSKDVVFSLSDSTFESLPFEFHINDGMLEGILKKKKGIEGHFKMSNFDANVLTQFIDDNRLKVSGLVFGEVSVNSNAINTDLDIDISLKNGSYMEQKFNEMIISCLLRNNVLHIDDISMTKKDEVGFNLSGIYPFTSTKGRIPSISIVSNFSNFPLKFINLFSPNFFQLEGQASGEFLINGSLQKSYYDYSLNVNNMYFDLVNLGKVALKGSYNNNKLYVDRFNSISSDGEINSSGSIPFDLNLGSKNLGQLFSDDILDFHIDSKMKKLPFLTPYISDLDSVIGNFSMTLSLSGFPKDIQRNGKLSIENGLMYSMQLTDPIKALNGKAVIDKNILKVDEMFALVYNPRSNYIEQKKPNTQIVGSIDISQFFKPKYNLSIKAKDVSYELLSIDISGLANLDLNISGRDTVEIVGKIESIDAEIFYEFNTEEIGTALDDNGVVMSYNLNIPLRSSAFFQNSQIDAELLGEINLSQKGHQEIDFGGQIIVENGSVFSYKDNFNDLQGFVSFDNKGFNPFVDVNAYTFIEDERINLRITGGIEDLDIVLESGSGFSESDILELLTWGKRFEDQEMTSTGFGNQTVSILGSLLENQLEKNLKESNIGMMNYVDDIDIKGAASLLQGADEDFELTAKRKIGDKTYLNLSYKRSFSLNQDQSQIGVEYKLSRHFSVVGNMDREGNLNLKYRYRYAY